MKTGTPFELTWRNDDLSDPPGKRPEGFGAEHRLESRILALEPNRKLSIAWNQGEVSFELEPAGDKVLLTVIHRRLPDRTQLLNVSAGWHAHLDVLVTRISGKPQTTAFWDIWSELKAEYDRRLAGLRSIARRGTGACACPRLAIIWRRLRREQGRDPGGGFTGAVLLGRDRPRRAAVATRPASPSSLSIRAAAVALRR